MIARAARPVFAGAVLALLALLGGCSQSKEDIVQKARGVSTRAELEKALGKPSDIAKLFRGETLDEKRIIKALAVYRVATKGKAKLVRG